MNNQQVYQSLFPMTNMGLYDTLKPIKNNEVSIINNNENQGKTDRNIINSCCCDCDSKCDCDNDTLCKCKKLNDMFDRLECNY